MADQAPGTRVNRRLLKGPLIAYVALFVFHLALWIWWVGGDVRHRSMSAVILSAGLILVGLGFLAGRGRSQNWLMAGAGLAS